MTHTFSAPVNLLTELDEYSSGYCIRRVMARILGHAGLALGEAEDVWLKAEEAWKEAGHQTGLFRQYIGTIQALS